MKRNTENNNKSAEHNLDGKKHNNKKLKLEDLIEFGEESSSDSTVYDIEEPEEEEDRSGSPEIEITPSGQNMYPRELIELIEGNFNYECPSKSDLEEPEEEDRSGSPEIDLEEPKEEDRSGSPEIDLEEPKEEDRSGSPGIDGWTNPAEVHLKENDVVSDLCLHQTENIFCGGGHSGFIHVGHYKSDLSEVDIAHCVHKGPVRHVEFLPEGDSICSVSAFQITISDLETMKSKNIFKISETMPEQMVACTIDENLMAIGNESGCVKLWDIRQEKCIFELDVDENSTLSSITSDKQTKNVACASLDGCLAIIDFRNKKKVYQIDYPYEITGSTLVRSNTRLVCSTSKGLLVFHNWGTNYDPCENFSTKLKKPFNQINKILTARDDVTVIACDDGKLRAVQVFPHQLLGVIGEHKYSVEAVSVSGDGRIIASASFDGPIKFWNVSYLHKKYDLSHEKNKLSESNLPSSNFGNPKEFYSGLQ